MTMESEIYDRRGYAFRLGDVVKVLHFTAALRCRKHYMYKQVIGEEYDGQAWKMSHLDLERKLYFTQFKDDLVHHEFEIVQAEDACWEDTRLRKAPYYRVECFKVWEGINPNKKLWRSVGYVSSNREDMNEIAKELRRNTNKPYRVVRSY